MSKGQEQLFEYFTQLFDAYEIVQEYHIGERLFLDVYCPELKVAGEYHGVQHFEFNSHFYDNMLDFRKAQERDLRKEELCRQQQIALSIYRYDEELSSELVYNRVLESIRGVDTSIDPPPQSYQEQAAERRRQYNREQYRKWKNLNKRK
jgi:hypothetical protein